MNMLGGFINWICSLAVTSALKDSKTLPRFHCLPLNYLVRVNLISSGIFFITIAKSNSLYESEEVPNASRPLN